MAKWAYIKKEKLAVQQQVWNAVQVKQLVKAWARMTLAHKICKKIAGNIKQRT
jgi:hypothetical protein